MSQQVQRPEAECSASVFRTAEREKRSRGQCGQEVRAEPQSDSRREGACGQEGLHQGPSFKKITDHSGEDLVQ